MTSRRISFSIEGVQPCGQPRPFPFIDPRSGKMVQRHKMSKGAKLWKQAVKDIAGAYSPATPIDSPIEAELIFYLKATKTREKQIRKEIAKQTGAKALDIQLVDRKCGIKPDGDNLEKLVFDAMTELKTWWVDDSRIWKVNREKWLTFDGKCGLWITLWWEE